jgi:hypothetical protein
MTSFTLRQHKRYRAEIRLSFVEAAVASEARIVEELSKLGWIDVTVSGSGRDRVAEGTWPSTDVTVDLPDRIKSVEEVE